MLPPHFIVEIFPLTNFEPKSINNINIYNLNKQVKFKGYGYYIGKIENMSQKDCITTMEVSPTTT